MKHLQHFTLCLLLAGLPAVSSSALAAPLPLQISGASAQPFQLRPAELAKLKRQSLQAVDHEGQPASFEGYALSDVLALAGVHFDKEHQKQTLTSYLLVNAADGYRVIFALPELDPGFTDRRILLADKRDGKPLAAGEGPWKLVVPGEKRQARWVRQVTGLTIKGI